MKKVSKIIEILICLIVHNKIENRPSLNMDFYHHHNVLGNHHLETENLNLKN